MQKKEKSKLNERKEKANLPLRNCEMFCTFDSGLKRVSHNFVSLFLTKQIKKKKTNLQTYKKKV